MLNNRKNVHSRNPARAYQNSTHKHVAGHRNRDSSSWDSLQYDCDCPALHHRHCRPGSAQWSFFEKMKKKNVVLWWCVFLSLKRNRLIKSCCFLLSHTKTKKVLECDSGSTTSILIHFRNLNLGAHSIVLKTLRARKTNIIYITWQWKIYNFSEFVVCPYCVCGI